MMNWLQSILFGLVSGLSEFIPISAQAHSDIFHYMFGIVEKDPVMSLFINIALLISLLTALRMQFDQLQREQKLQRRNRKNPSLGSLHTLADIRLVKNAAIPMLICMVLLRYILRIQIQLPVTSAILILNGIIIYLSERMVHGNKDAHRMSLLDSYCIGIAGALSLFSGLSAIGLMMSLALARGADRLRAWSWALYLMIPAICASIIMDFVSIFAGNATIPFFSSLIHYILAALAAFAAGRLAIFLMRRLIRQGNNTVFAYYSWGAALFSFLLFLSVT